MDNGRHRDFQLLQWRIFIWAVIGFILSLAVLVLIYLGGDLGWLVT